MVDNFKSFIVCLKCHSLYKIEDCIDHSGPQRNPVTNTKKCRFPNHPQKRFQRPYNEKIYILSVGYRIKIQDKVNRMVPPSDVGRISTKISSNFNNFTADELKN